MAELGAALIDEVDRKGEFLMKAEGATDLDFLGDNDILRHGDGSAETQLDEHAAGPEHVYPRS